MPKRGQKGEGSMSTLWMVLQTGLMPMSNACSDEVFAFAFAGAARIHICHKVGVVMMNFMKHALPFFVC